MTSDQAWELAVTLAGGAGKLCERMGVSRQTLSNWRRRRLPLRRAMEIVELSGGAVQLGDLRPEYADVRWVIERG